MTAPRDPGGEGALRYHMDTHCQMAARTGSDERQNLGEVRSFWGKKGGGQLHTKNTAGAELISYQCPKLRILLMHTSGA